MALSDYRVCDGCGAKTFYDSHLHFEDREPGDETLRFAGEPDEAFWYTLVGVGDWAVLCTECSRTHRTAVLPMGLADVEEARVSDDEYEIYSRGVLIGIAAFKKDFSMYRSCGDVVGSAKWRFRGFLSCGEHNTKKRLLEHVKNALDIFANDCRNPSAKPIVYPFETTARKLSMLVSWMATFGYVPFGQVVVVPETEFSPRELIQPMRWEPSNQTTPKESCDG